MKTQITILGILLNLVLLLPTNLFAQRNAPVVGDAAQLIDILKKDYSTISKDRRQEEITDDQARVITFFTTYLIDDERLAFKKNWKIKTKSKNLPISKRNTRNFRSRKT